MSLGARFVASGVMVCVLIVLVLITGSRAEPPAGTRAKGQTPDLITSVPRTMTYQANLTDISGENAPPGDYNITFRLYDALNEGNLLWDETVTVAVSNNGTFTAVLGETEPLNLSFDVDYYLSLQVEGDDEMEPRQKLHMSPYAAVADSSDYAENAGYSLDADLLDGLDSGDFAGSNHDHDADYVNEGQLASITTDMIDDLAVTDVKIAALAVGNTHIQDAAVDQEKLADNAVTGAKIADGTIQFGDVGQNGAASGQVMKWDGSAWAAADDQIGTTWNWSDSSSHGPDSVLFADISNHADVSDSTGAITDGGVDFADIGQNGAASGQIMKWDGSAWAAADDDAGVDADWVISGNDMYSGVSGNVGIGIETPIEKLDILGNIKASGTIISGNSVTIDGVNDRITASGGTIDFDDENLVTSGKATIGPGHTNTGTNAFVTGESNTASGSRSSVAGGQANTASGGYSHVGGGNNNEAGGLGSMVGGGVGNYAPGSIAAICGGNNNTANGALSIIGGGASNIAGDSASVVAGGKYNKARGKYSVVSGGGGPTAADSNSAIGDYSTVGGGSTNAASGIHATVGGGLGNSATDYYATIGGGIADSATGYVSTIGGGWGNSAGGDGATVGGGWYNKASGGSSSIGGGYSNTASGNYSMVGGGYNNSNAGSYSVIVGGYQNTLNSAADYSMYFGRLGDLTSSYRAVFFNATYSGRMGINRDDNDGGISYPIHVGTSSANGNGARLTSGGVWTNGSSRTFKEDFRAWGENELLSSIAAVPVGSWKFRDSEERHFGPYAEDFVAAFDVGTIRESDGQRENQYLAAGDVAGVALAGVQALLDKIERLEARIAELEAERKLRNSK